MNRFKKTLEILGREYKKLNKQHIKLSHKFDLCGSDYEYEEIKRKLNELEVEMCEISDQIEFIQRLDQCR
jgi:hypothetical protein